MVVALVEPGTYRGIHQQVVEASEGNGRLELLSLAVTDAADPAQPASAPPPPSSASRSASLALPPSLPLPQCAALVKLYLPGLPARTVHL